MPTLKCKTGPTLRSASKAVTAAHTVPARLKFWGVRGSVPTPGPTTIYYGGNTSCLEVRADGEIIILDAGTGLRPLGRELVSEFNDLPLELTLLLTHTHWDHIQGLPYFLPIYKPQNQVRILGYEGARQGLVSILANQMESPYFPIRFDKLPGNIIIEELKDMQFDIGSVRVQAAFANHPGLCVGYRLSTSGGSIAFFPDTELHYCHRAASQDSFPHGGARARGRNEDQDLVGFLQGTDALIIDAQYDDEEYKLHAGWGHGCVNDVVALALQAQVKQLFLFHHDPDHDDTHISKMVERARQIVTERSGSLRVEAAREGVTVELPAS
jgi:phosphoribosyl 1,2-cyclic phosphodiesterase